MNHAEQAAVTELEAYEPPELTVVGDFESMTKGNYSKPHSDDGDAGGYWSP